MIFASRRDVHWAKPEDIPYQKGKMKSEVGGFYNGSVHVAFGDGSVRTLKLDELESAMLEQIILPYDGLIGARLQSVPNPFLGSLKSSIPSKQAMPVEAPAANSFDFPPLPEKRAASQLPAQPTLKESIKDKK